MNQLNYIEVIEYPGYSTQYTEEEIPQTLQKVCKAFIKTQHMDEK